VTEPIVNQPILDRLALLIGRFLALGFLLIAVMMTFEVVSRYGFNAPTIWAHEVSGVIAAVAFAFGGAYCMADNSHMRITIISERFGPKARRAVEFLSLGVGGIYLAGLVYATARMTDKALFRFSALTGEWDPERSGTSWNTAAPGFIKLALCVAAALFLLIVLQRVVALLRQR